MGFKEEKAEVKELMVTEFNSPLIAEIRANNGTIVRGDMTIKLAEYYGFCWGVERAVSNRIYFCSNIYKIFHIFQYMVLIYHVGINGI